MQIARDVTRARGLLYSLLGDVSAVKDCLDSVVLG